MSVNSRAVTRTKVITTRLRTAPVALQSLRKKIIDNANLMIEEFKKFEFVEFSEIVRVCTALGIKRAYLRGLQFPIASEEDIDKYIHRFNLRGALPFQDQTYPTSATQQNWTGGGYFASAAFRSTNNTHSILLQCINVDGNTFIQCKDSTVDFIQGNRILPLTAFIPKYREAGADPDVPWLPIMTCNLLNNIEDSENCISTMDVSTGAVDPPDLNILIAAGTNQFPYITPNAGFPYSKVVNPDPKPLRMIMDGSPIEGEEIILQNRFELTGTVVCAVGEEDVLNTEDDPTTVTGEGGGGDSGEEETIPSDSAQRTDPPYSEYEVTLDADGNFIANTTDSYAGPVLIIKDPIRGTDTRFDEELVVNDIIELNFPDRSVGGSFFTVGDDTIYYRGTDFLNLYQANIKLMLSGVVYTITSTVYNSTEKVDNYHGLTITYNASFKIDTSKTDIIRNDVSSSLFNNISKTVNIIPSTTNKKYATLTFDPEFDPTTSFELGDLLYINDGTNTHEYRFLGISTRTLDNLYRVDGTLIPNGLSNCTLVRNAKSTRALETIQGGMLPEFKMYFTVSGITSNTEITVNPAYIYPQTYEGKINRIGFNIKSNSQSPDLINNGFDVEGVGQFLLKGSATGSDVGNSPTFLIPSASTESVIFYRGTDFTRSGSDATLRNLTAKDVYSVTSALDSYINVYNYSSFTIAQGTPIYPSEYAGFSAFDDIASESRIGILYFTDGEDPYIILETMIDNNPVSHGFAAGNILQIRKVKYNPSSTDDPYGDLVSYTESTHLFDFDYSHCGLEIEVADVVNPYRFKILKKGKSGLSSANKFFDEYDDNTTHYLTATNGKSLEYWSKYFKPVYMDGTVTANSENEYAVSNVTRTFTLCSKGDSASDYYHNYNAIATSFDYLLGSTAVNIEMDGNRVDIVDGGGFTDDGTFILSLKTPLTAPPNLLDSYLLRVVEYDQIEIE